MCVPASHAQQVYDIAHGREVIEGVIKEELVKSKRPHTREQSDVTPLSHTRACTHTRGRLQQLCLSRALVTP